MSLAGISEGMGHYFNSERSMVALLGGLMIVSGVNMFKSDQPLAGASASAGATQLLGGGFEARKQLAGLLFSGGWLIIALSTVYRHSQAARGIMEPLNAKTLLAFASVIAVITGATMARAEFDADPTAEAVTPMARALFLGGWLGLLLVMVSRSIMPFSLWSQTKIALAVIGVLTTLAGVMSTRAYELEDAKEFLGGNFENAVERARDWPKWLFGLGWFIIAMAIGYHN